MALLTNWFRQEQLQALPAGHSWGIHQHSTTPSSTWKANLWPQLGFWNTKAHRVTDSPEILPAFHAVTTWNAIFCAWSGGGGGGEFPGKTQLLCPRKSWKPIRQQFGKLKVPVPTRTDRAWLVAQVSGFSSFHRHLNTSFSVQLINTLFFCYYSAAKPNIGRGIKIKGFCIFLLPLPFFCVFAKQIAFYRVTVWLTWVTTRAASCVHRAQLSAGCVHFSECCLVSWFLTF